LSKDQTSAPRAFISYSWTSPEHERWVMDLATQLVEHGVDVILDKWNLREGHDAVQFMESMVTDEKVSKVIVVSDKAYAEKADKRKGGVGTESQIISPEIYNKADQNKFAAVVPEVDDNGEPYLPRFFVSRIYIDLTESRYATNFEQLLRWLYDKPQFVKPPLGKMPEFLSETKPASPTRAKVQRTIDIINTAAVSPAASTIRYLDSLVEVLESFRIDPGAPDFPNAVIESIGQSIPYRNEFIEFVMAAAIRPDAEFARDLQRFFERVVPLMSRPPSVSSWRDWDYDNYVFIVHELFLYAVAALLRRGRFETLSEFLGLRFYLESETRAEVMQSFTVVWRPMKALGPKQQELRRMSLRADLLEQRSHVASGLKFTDVMAADFVLFLRAAALEPNDRWYPETLLYTVFRFHHPFEIFARAESRAFFQRLSPVIGIGSRQEMEALIATYSIDGRSGGRWLPRWEYDSLNIPLLSNVANLETRA
jgi:SEFIR domain-containing protein